MKDREWEITVTEKLTHEEIRKREALKQVMESELFKQALYEVRQELGHAMLRTNDSAERERLHLESTLMNRLESKLTEFCNELIFLKKDEAA
jgi:hypothetical protein